MVYASRPLSDYTQEFIAHDAITVTTNIGIATIGWRRHCRRHGRKRPLEAVRQRPDGHIAENYFTEVDSYSHGQQDRGPIAFDRLTSNKVEGLTCAGWRAGAMRTVTLLVVIAATAFGATARAATVVPGQGIVMVNHGLGYQQVAGSTDVSPGATVVVGPGGSAQVVYPGGCTVLVEPGSVVAVAPQPPCLTTGAIDASPDPSPGTSGTTWAVGAVAAGGGVGAAVLLSRKSKSASP